MAISGAAKPAKGIRFVVEFCEVLIILLHRSLQTVKFFLKSVNLYKFREWCPDFLADKPHLQFAMKFLN